ncbi:MAG: bifunctional phosphoglucose/phosphomannose isomerase [Candidatus Bipolaricaulia bacterium]
MIDLDDRAALARIDRADMRALLRAFPDQIDEAGEWQADVPSLDAIDRIVVCGMGGSAIGGDLLATLWGQWGVARPVVTVRGYALPPWVDDRTLAIMVSYSGNTEETLACARQARKRGCAMLAITSGGQLAELARSADVPLILVPGDQPPRASLGYLLAPLLRSLAPHIDRDVAADIDAALPLIRSLVAELDESPHDANRAKQLARDLEGAIPVCYGSAGLTEPVARRWKTQLNENAKSPAYWDVVPELNHNELMGWEGDDLADRASYVLLRDADEASSVARRLEITADMLRDRGLQVREVQLSGETLMARMLGLIVLGDWVSYYRAMLREVDPTPVALIERFKAKMAEAF